jgi:hypothetical protein
MTRRPLENSQLEKIPQVSSTWGLGFTKEN